MASFKINNILIPEALPLIALKNTVLFPKVVIPLIVQRPKSVEALEVAMRQERLVFFVTQKSIEDNVRVEDLFRVGTVGRIVAVFRLPDGSSKVDVEGMTRGRISDYITEEPFFKVKFDPIASSNLSAGNLEERALSRLVIDQFRNVVELKTFPSASPDVIYMMSQLKDLDQVVSLI